ncbi:hypothetical protein LWI29_023377 [Acer saccharum]|uniref:Protein kinase domain-containing protein n=1 Tax=Acer saccharum TaxID=4024 RepID=A0AA39VR52_ACESA|nr:hypothetical protein LWI29_023377 [Acer saccharum]
MGAFGVIRECSDKLTGEVLACKSIAKDRLVTVDDVRSIKLEIEIMTRLSGHPNVVDLKAVYEEEDFVHLVMELCAGGELFHRLEKYGRFSENEARVVFMYLMQVVKYCHDNGVCWGYTVHSSERNASFWGKTKSKIFEAVKAADLRFPSNTWDHISASARDLIVGMLCIDPSKRLSATEVLAHSWIGDCVQAAQELHEQDALCCKTLEVSEDSIISATFIDRNQDYSFGEQSSAFTCKSSFSTFPVDNGTPDCSANGGFSFSSCCESSAPDFSSPIPSMPSFTFLSPSSAVGYIEVVICF